MTSTSRSKKPFQYHHQYSIFLYLNVGSPLSLVSFSILFIGFDSNKWLPSLPFVCLSKLPPCLFSPPLQPVSSLITSSALPPSTPHTPLYVFTWSHVGMNLTGGLIKLEPPRRRWDLPSLIWRPWLRLHGRFSALSKKNDEEHTGWRMNLRVFAEA